MRVLDTARALGLCLLIAGATQLHGGFRESELQCEEAVAHLADCCEKTLGIDCTHHDEGCDQVPPELSVEDSRCIRDLDCDEIRERGLCSPAHYADAGAEAKCE
jgi:hypothetical protein